MRMPLSLIVTPLLLLCACANEGVAEQTQGLSAAGSPAAEAQEVAAEARLEAAPAAEAQEVAAEAAAIPTSNVPAPEPCALGWLEYEQAVMANVVSSNLAEPEFLAACERMPEAIRPCLTAGYTHNNADRCTGEAERLHPELRSEFAGLLPNHSPLSGSLRLEDPSIAVQ